MIFFPPKALKVDDSSWAGETQHRPVPGRALIFVCTSAAQLRATWAQPPHVTAPRCNSKKPKPTLQHDITTFLFNYLKAGTCSCVVCSPCPHSVIGTDTSIPVAACPLVALGQSCTRVCPSCPHPGEKQWLEKPPFAARVTRFTCAQLRLQGRVAAFVHSWGPDLA